MSGVPHSQTASVTRVVTTFLLYGIVAIPLGGYSWDVVSDLISGHLTSRKALIGVPVIIAFLIVLRLAAGALSRLDTSTSNNG